MDTTAATMDLLDLPLEVFYMIVYRYIMLWGLVGIMPLLASGTCILIDLCDCSDAPNWRRI